MRASKKYYLADKNAAATQSRATAQHGSTVESAASHSTGKTALGIGLVGLGSWAAYELLREDKSKTQNLER
jgi:hypothetical protein